MPSLPHDTKRLTRSLLAALALALASLAQTALTANTGISSSDTYVLFDLSVSGSTTVTTSSPIYNAATGTSSTTAPSRGLQPTTFRPATTRAAHW